MSKYRLYHKLFSILRSLEGSAGEIYQFMCRSNYSDYTVNKGVSFTAQALKYFFSYSDGFDGERGTFKCISNGFVC